MNPLFEFHKNLKKYNTFSISANAGSFAVFKSEEQLITLLKEGQKNNQTLLILGGGSNILFTKDFDGMVLKNDIKGIQILSETDQDILIKCGGGETWHSFVTHCVNKGWSGIENLSLIPGTVGASPIQNIGAYGVEVKDSIESVEGVNRTDYTKKRFNASECAFGYRDSIFKKELKDKYIITFVVFRLKKHAVINTSYGAIQQVLTEKGIANPTLKDVSNAVIEIRKSKLPDPAVLGNAGSFFKNPEIPQKQFEDLKADHPDIISYPGFSSGMIKLPAGWLIEQCGWKGKVWGNTGVHKMQALVLVNYGKASGQDILDLSIEIRKSVKEKFGIELETEVNIM